MLIIYMDLEQVNEKLKQLCPTVLKLYDRSRCSILIPTMWSLPHPHIPNLEPLTHLEQLNVEPLTYSEQLNLELLTHSEHFNVEPLTFSQRCIARAIELFLLFSG